MKRSPLSAFIACCLLPQGAVLGESAVSTTLGFNKVVCLPNSDTIVGIPFRQQGSRSGALASAPDVSGDSATLTLSGNLALPPGELDKHYVKFSSGAKDGRFYDITGNTADTLTIDLNGDSLGGTAEGDKLVIAEYWTLDTLFPPDKATTSWTETPEGSGNWVPNGHAVVASSSTLARRTEILLPNLTGQGTNLAPTTVYFIHQGIWKIVGSGDDQGGVVLYPDNYMIVRNNANVANSTIFSTSGDVDYSSMAIPLSTRVVGSQDNHVAVPRPVAVRLIDLGLDSSVFVESPSALNRRDEILIFDNSLAAKNKGPTAVYFKTAASWRKVGTADNEDDAVIPPGHGIIIRKYPTESGQTVFWNNFPAY